jgi:hypothetical protein
VALQHTWGLGHIFLAQNATVRGGCRQGDIGTALPTFGYVRLRLFEGFPIIVLGRQKGKMAKKNAEKEGMQEFH